MKTFHGSPTVHVCSVCLAFRGQMLAKKRWLVGQSKKALGVDLLQVGGRGMDEGVVCYRTGHGAPCTCTARRWTSSLSNNFSISTSSKTFTASLTVIFFLVDLLPPTNVHIHKCKCHGIPGYVPTRSMMNVHQWNNRSNVRMQRYEVAPNEWNICVWLNASVHYATSSQLDGVNQGRGFWNHGVT